MTKVLLFTLSEYGQANTILALAEELASRQDVEAQVCSFPVLKKRVESISASSPNPIKFHSLKGPSFLKAAEVTGVTPEWLPTPPSSRSNQPFHNITMVFSAFDDETYAGLVEECKSLVKSADPDLIVIDTMCTFAADACRLLNRRYIINNPMQAMDCIRRLQPWLKGIWYYPALFSGYPFPVPWRLLFSNIWIFLNMMVTLITSPRLKALSSSRKQYGYIGDNPLMNPYHPDIDLICPSIEETDYPCVCPPNVHRFGTITVDTIPLQHSDPEMKAWLDKRKTVVISLGTHAPYTEEMVRGFLWGLLDRLPADMQVLWKLKGKKKFDDVIEEMLGPVPKNRERFRILDWFVADPKAIMEHPNVVCYVHHGGANSYFECCLAAVPQIIIAMWFDLYENASKAEYRGLGVYGNRSSAPGVDAIEFGEALARVIGPGPEATKLKENVLRVSKLCKEAGGKKAAVDFILGTVKRGRVLRS